MRAVEKELESRLLNRNIVLAPPINWNVAPATGRRDAKGGTAFGVVDGP
jgi:hypothetical protein